MPGAKALQARELHQLQLVVRYYLDAAGKRVASRQDVLMKDVWEKFTPEHVPTQEDYERLYLGADLGSAATRLWTIDERIGNLYVRHFRQHFNGKFSDKDLRDLALNDFWLHGMLRDNLAHAE